MLGGCRTPVHAAPPVEVQNVRVGFGQVNTFKIGAWTPVWVQLGAGPDRFSGFMDLVVPDDDGIPTSYRQTVELGPRQSQRLTAYGRPGGKDTEFTIRLFDSQGRRVLEVPQGISMPKPPESIMPDEKLILTIGQPMGVDQIPTLPGFVQAAQARQGLQSGSGGAEIVVARIETQGDSMPGRWYGYNAAHCIVVDTDDRAVLQALDALKGQSLVDWVKHGGHLVVSVGANWQAVRDSVLGPILPALPNGQERVTSLEALDAFAESNKPITPPGTPPVMVTKLENVAGARRQGAQHRWAALPLVVRGAHGFGRVTLIGLATDQKLLADWPDRGLFWARALDLKHEGLASPASGARIAGGGGRFYQSGVSDLSSQLRIALEQFPNVKLIPFGWVAFFIFLYILMIGPGDYFFLKKVLKRMELTWITFPTIVVTVSLLAYFAAYRLKGNDLLVNKVDVIDVDQPGGLVRGRTLVSVFSPQNRDYNVGFVPVAPNLDREVSPLAASELLGRAAAPCRRQRGRDHLVQHSRARSSGPWEARTAGSASWAAAIRTNPSAASSGSKTCGFPSGARRRSRPSGSVPRARSWTPTFIRWAPTACRERSRTGRTTRCKTRSWPLASKSTYWGRWPPERRSGWPSPATETSPGS